MGAPEPVETWRTTTTWVQGTQVNWAEADCLDMPSRRAASEIELMLWEYDRDGRIAIDNFREPRAALEDSNRNALAVTQRSSRNGLIDSGTRSVTRGA
jgi:hypothetical protein